MSQEWTEFVFVIWGERNLLDGRLSIYHKTWFVAQIKLAQSAAVFAVNERDDAGGDPLKSQTRNSRDSSETQKDALGLFFLDLQLNFYEWIL